MVKTISSDPLLVGATARTLVVEKRLREVTKQLESIGKRLNKVLVRLEKKA